MTIKYSVQKTHLLVQERTKWKNSRLSTETPGYQLGSWLPWILKNAIFILCSENTMVTKNHFFTILTGFPEIQSRPITNYDFWDRKSQSRFFFSTFS